VNDSNNYQSSAWIEGFHAGRREIMEECYRTHFSDVEKSVSRMLSGVDLENVVHEVFAKILANKKTRLSFKEGSFPSWLSAVARNLAVDYIKRNQKEHPVEPRIAEKLAENAQQENAEDIELKRVIERFRGEKVPEKWLPVFDARFIRRLTQREAAKELGISRTTLAYREGRIRKRLRRFIESLEEKAR
jgi:RNA polymerase sigma-70 factor (ECF subfamily)